MESLSLLKCMNEIIHNPLTLEVSRLSERSFTRERKMSFTEAVSFFFDLKKTSLQTRLNNYFHVFKRGMTMTQQGFSKLRGKFSHKPFEMMLREIVSKEYSGKYPLETWNGLHVFAVDGSHLQLPNTDELKEIFGTRGEYNQCTSAGISVLYDVFNGWALDPIITHANMNERTECEKHISFLRDNLSHINNSLILLDRGYPSQRLIKSIHDAKMKYLMRCNSAFYPVVDNAPMGNSVVTLPKGLSVRVYKFLLPCGNTETLLTNLFDAPDADLSFLYHKRWVIETMYGNLKNIVCLENFSGRTPNVILQDFWVSMVLINSIAVFQKEANEAIAKKHKYRHRKYEYKVKTSDLVVTLRERFVFACLRRNKILSRKQMESVINTLSLSVSPVRPDRSFPHRRDNRRRFNLFLKSHL